MNDQLELLLLLAQEVEDRLMVLQVDGAVVTNHLPHSDPVLRRQCLRLFRAGTSLASLAAAKARAIIAVVNAPSLFVARWADPIDKLCLRLLLEASAHSECSLALVAVLCKLSCRTVRF